MENNYKFKAILFAVLLMFASFSFAQIPNAGFETWTGGSCLIVNSYNDPNSWGTINVLTCPGGSFTATRSGTAHSGSYALKLSTVSIFGQIAPGICATGVINQTTQNIDGGYADATRHTFLKGWYQYAPTGVDTFSVQVDFYHGSITPANLIGTGSFYQTAAVSSYTQFSVPITYSSALSQDSAVITILCSSPNTHGNPGTYCLVDDLSFVNCNGFGATATPTAATCTQNDGGVSLGTPVNGTSPYTYAWSNAATASSISSVSAGTYTVTITDVNGCKAIDTVVVQSNNVNLSVTLTPGTSSCVSNTGTVNTTVTGGTPSYSYNWSNAGTSQNLSGLAPGSYKVTVTDSHGCSGSANTSVNTANGPSATDSTFGVLCHGASTGAVHVAVTGGTGNIVYAWNSGQTTANIDGIPAGSYSLTITDANNCSFLVSTDVLEPATALSATSSTTNPLCHGNTTGTVTVVPTGGTGNYTYGWSNTATTQNLTGLTAGIYILTITDDNGCSFALSDTITEPDALGATITVTNATSSTSNDGKLKVTATGGTTPLSYLWNTTATRDSITHLSPGNYCVTVTDVHFCSVSLCDSVKANPSVGINTITENPVKLYPNPASSQIIIETGSSEGKFQFCIYSLDGKLVDESTITGAKTIIDTRNLTDGIYSYHVIDSNTGKTQNGRLVIQK